MIGRMIAVARLPVRRCLRVLEGQRVVQTVLQGLVLGVVGRRRLGLAAIARYQARPHSARKERRRKMKIFPSVRRYRLV